MRAYTVATVAVSLRMPVKWVDNVLSHYHVAGVSRARQGVSRRLTPQGVLILELCVRLTDVLSIPLPRALEAAETLIRKAEGLQPVDLGRGIRISMDIEAIRLELMERLADAVEVAPIPRRGRPRRPA